MNFLKKGPELKLSELKKIKVPSFVEDVFYDLKDRHLLPVAAILLVAIFAVPIAISDSGSGEEAGGAGSAGISADPGPEPTGALVAESAPNLRKYQKRLEGQSAKNPFAKKFQQSQAPTDGEGGEGGEESFSTGSPESGEPSYSYVPSETGGGGGGSGDSGGRLIHYSYVIDVRITGGSGNKKKSTVRRNLPPLSMLPSRETPAIVYIGATKDGQKAVVTVSSDVQAIFGDGKCVLGSQTCQMLVMEPGLPETFVYGGAEKTYKIELIEVNLVESDKVNKAALGDPNKGKDNSKTGNRSLAADSVVAAEQSR